MIISFAWTTPALLAGAKTVTRRDWTYGHAQKFTVGMLVDAYDRSPRAHGRKVATIRITRPPHRESTANLPVEDYAREGFAWLREHGHRETVDRIMESWGMYPREVWVVQFELVEVLPRTGGIIEPGGHVQDIGECTVELVDHGREVLGPAVRQ